MTGDSRPGSKSRVKFNLKRLTSALTLRFPRIDIAVRKAPTYLPRNPLLVKFDVVEHNLGLLAVLGSLFQLWKNDIPLSIPDFLSNVPESKAGFILRFAKRRHVLALYSVPAQ